MNQLKKELSEQNQRIRREKEKCVTVSLEELLALKKEGTLFSRYLLRNRRGGSKPSPRLVAQGMEFSESRRYYEGDDVRNIDWKVTARTGKTHTKLFTEENETRVLLLLDMTNSMYFATKGVFKSVQASLMAANIAWSSFNQGHLFSALIFDEETIFQIERSDLKGSILPFLETLAEKSQKIQPRKGEEPKNFILPSNKEKSENKFLLSLQKIKKLAKPGSLIFVISDFRNVSPYSIDLLEKISKDSELVLCFLYDALEKEIPKKKFFKFSDGIKEKLFRSDNEQSLKEYTRKFILRREKIDSLATNKNGYFLECSTEDDYREKLKKYFN